MFHRKRSKSPRSHVADDAQDQQLLSLQERAMRSSLGSHSSIGTATTRTGSLPRRGLDRQWSACSLCSIDSLDVDDQLPIPGRESHTTDINQFLTYIHRLNNIRRFDGDPPLNLQFWKFIKDVLTKAVPVGYTELDDCEAVEPKSAQDNAAFLQKIAATSIINPIDPIVIAERVGVSLDDVLTELLYAAKIDMVRMRWFPDCCMSGVSSDTCASVRPKKKKPTYCNRCKYRNAIDVLNKIKVIFYFNSDIFFALAETTDDLLLNIKESENNDLLAVVPATFTGSGYRYSVGCGEEHMLRDALVSGRYKVGCPLATTFSFLDVERAAWDDDEPCVLRIHVSDILPRRGRRRKNLKVPHGKLHLDFFTDTHPFFICAMSRVDDEDQEDYDGTHTRDDTTSPTRTYRQFTSAQMIMDHPAYLNLFEGTEVETFHFNSAVKKMSLEPSTEANDLVAPMNALSCVSDDNRALEVGDEGSMLSSCC